MQALLEIKHLTTKIKSANDLVNPIQDLNLTLFEGETLGLVGESGSGKSITSLSILQLLSKEQVSLEGEILFQGKNILSLSEESLQKIRGQKISMIFQEPTAYLNPVFTCGYQLQQVIQLHQQISSTTAKEKSLELLRLVALSDPERVYDQYPHQLSGGMCQRVMIAMALSSRPQLLIADEPTTSLDAETQDQILKLIKDLQKKMNMSLLLISHDLSVIAKMCDRVALIERGRIVQVGKPDELLQKPQNKLKKEKDLFQDTLLEVQNLSKTINGKIIFKDISFSVKKGETLALVGRSGSGKSTLARCLLNLRQATSGQVIYKGQIINSLPASQFRPLRRNLQIIFQDSYLSLNPKITVKEHLQEALAIHNLYKNKMERAQRALELIQLIGLSVEHLERLPTELSGGQRQRVNIARALAVEPELIICDEPVSSLDSKTQKQIMDLLSNLQKEFSLTYLFICHDMNLVENFADRIISL